MESQTHDIAIIRRLASEYAETAALAIQDNRRALWRAHNSLRTMERPVLLRFGFWNAWAKRYFADERMECSDPFWRSWERTLRIALFHQSLGDDQILEPWLVMRAVIDRPSGSAWGIPYGHKPSDLPDGAYQFAPELRNWADMDRLVATHHHVDETATMEAYERLDSAVKEILPIKIDRSPLLYLGEADFSYPLAQLRGLEQMMLDMVDSPNELHQLLSFMLRAIQANQAEAEQAGDLHLFNSYNQQMPYCDELPAPGEHASSCQRSDLWYYLAAQECTAISPRMFDEYIVQYQRQVAEPYGLLAYGCCEDLTEKIGVLRQFKNLRVIAVTPRADTGRCADQIGTDYVISWRPNPADMVCGEFSREKVSAILQENLVKLRGTYTHIILKDVEELGGDVTRLAAWVNWTREAASRLAS
ncbi:MAG: uroporphyrinogen decarboxylase/cobalamine-independent methonine synthase family protein [Anaerolineae bacterium]